MKKKCPKCGSLNIEITDEDGLAFIKCKKCGFDELEEETLPGERTSQREKGRYSPYKTGGKGRTRRSG